MFRSRIFLRHFLKSCFTDNCNSFLVTGSFVSYETSRYLSNKEKRQLILELDRLTTMLTPSFLSQQNWQVVLQKYSDHSISRITLIKRSGSVVFDSSTSKQLENHLDRPEMKAAMSGLKEYVERYSDTLQKYDVLCKSDTRQQPNSPTGPPYKCFRKTNQSSLNFFIILFFCGDYFFFGHIRHTCKAPPDLSLR